VSMYLGLDTSHTTCILTTYFTTGHWIHKMYNNTIIQHVYNTYTIHVSNTSDTIMIVATWFLI